MKKTFPRVALVLFPSLLAATTSAQVGAPLEVQEIGGESGVLAGLLQPFDQLGAAVAAPGDLDGDGTADLVVGAPGTDARGVTYVLFLEPDGVVRAYHEIGDASGDLCDALGPLDQFGRAAAALGDLDGDGIPEVAIGAPGDDDGGADLGAVYVLSLSPDGTAAACTKISQTSGGFGGTLAPGGRFGTSVTALGDLDGDGVTELAVGAPVGTEAVWVLFLAADGTVRSETRIGDGVGGLGSVLDPSDGFGTSVAGPGDLDGDGRPDLVVGTPYDDDAATDAGCAYLLTLSATGTVTSTAKLTTGSGGMQSVLSDFRNFGFAAASIPDMGLDGVRDLVVGAPAGTGRYFVLELGAGGLVVGELEVRSLDLPPPFQGGLTGSLASAVAFLGDLDGDGAPTLALGAPGTSGASDGPRTWLVESCDGDPRSAFAAVGATSGASPLSVAFQDLSTGSGLSKWSWDFGDGRTSSLQNPTHVFTKVGTYDVTLTVTGTDGTCRTTQADLVVVDSALAQASERNGSGVNPDVLDSTGLPVLGTAWTAQVDASGTGAQGLVFLLGYEYGLAGVPTVFGEVLVDPTTAFLFLDVGVLVGSVSQHALDVPDDPSLLGCSVAVQALLNNPGLLSNAVDLVLGM